MAEYIDKEKLLQKLSRMIEYCKNDNKVNGLTALFQVGDAIMDCPTADVQEVKHGRWAHLGGDEWCCTCCGLVKHTEGHWEKPTAKYCEKCGAEINGMEH